MIKIKKILFLILILIVLTPLIISSLKIEIIHCSIEGINCSPELYSKLETLKNKSLFFTNFKEELNKNEFNYETIIFDSYKKQFPKTLILEFHEEKALYQINLLESKNNNTYFVSEFGNFLQNNQDSTNLVQIDWKIKASYLIKNDLIIQEKHSNIAKLIKSVNTNELKINRIVWNTDQNIAIIIENYPTIIIDTNVINNKVDTIKLLIKSKEIKDYEEPIKEIDLRFNLPVLRTSQ